MFSLSLPFSNGRGLFLTLRKNKGRQVNVELCELLGACNQRQKNRHDADERGHLLFKLLPRHFPLIGHVLNSPVLRLLLWHLHGIVWNLRVRPNDWRTRRLAFISFNDILRPIFRHVMVAELIICQASQTQFC